MEPGQIKLLDRITHKFKFFKLKSKNFHGIRTMPLTSVSDLNILRMQLKAQFRSISWQVSFWRKTSQEAENPQDSFFNSSTVAPGHLKIFKGSFSNIYGFWKEKGAPIICPSGITFHKAYFSRVEAGLAKIRSS